MACGPCVGLTPIPPPAPGGSRHVYHPRGDGQLSITDAFQNWMSDGSIADFGLLLELCVGAAYLWAAGKRSPRGSRWPRRRTAAFLAGLLVIALALDSGIAAHDEIPSVHILQHSLLMMLAPILLVLGAPITLAFRTVSSPGRRRMLAVLRDPSVRGLLARPRVLIADYNVTMAILMLAPVYRFAERHFAIHVAIHAYLIFCGLLFWTAILARDPLPARLPKRTRAGAAAVCIPINLMLATAVVVAPRLFMNAGPHGAAAAAILVTATTATSLFGMALVTRGKRRTTMAARLAETWRARGLVETSQLTAVK